VPRNDQADRENATQIAALPGKPRTYRASAEGQFPEDRLPAPRELMLKQDARVMFTRNDAERRWVNGSTGVVERVEARSVRVRLDSGDTYDVEDVTWDNYCYAYDSAEKAIVADVVGSYTQIPLMLAWAVTIHKAQGLTLDRVHVDFGRGAFAEGQAYVALSRCRRLSDLTLARPLRASDLRVSRGIVEFYARMRAAGALTIVWWNAGESDAATVADVVAEQHAALAILTGEIDESDLRRNYPHVTRHGEIVVASRQAVDIEAIGPRIAIVRVGAIAIVAVVFPMDEEKRAHWSALLEIADRLLGEPAMILGDLKTGAHHLDEEGATMLCAEEFGRLPEMGWIDAWRARNGTRREPTWTSPRGRGFRLDHCFVTPAIASRVECQYLHEVPAGHSMLAVSLRNR
jgi:hypothetical protein